MDRWRIGCTDRQAYGPDARQALRPAAKRTQWAMASGSSRSLGEPATARQGASEAPVGGCRGRPPRCSVQTQAPALEGGRHAERLGEEPRGVDRVPAGAGDDDLIHLPRAQRLPHDASWAGVPAGRADPRSVRSVRIRRADPGAPVPTGPPGAFGRLQRGAGQAEAHAFASPATAWAAPSRRRRRGR